MKEGLIIVASIYAAAAMVSFFKDAVAFLLFVISCPGVGLVIDGLGAVMIVGITGLVCLSIL